MPIWFALSFIAFQPVEISLDLVDTWKHDHIFGGYRFATSVLPDGRLAGMFQKDMPFVINKESYEQLRPRGQGPGDLQSAFGLFYGDDRLVIAEHTGKIKFFKQAGDAFEWERLVLRKAGPSGFFIDDLVFCQDRIFLAGFTMIMGRNDKITRTRVKVYDADGNFQKQLVSETGTKDDFVNHSLFKEQHLASDGKTLFFMGEESMRVWEIDGASASETRVVDLEKPAFYKPITDKHYAPKKGGGFWTNNEIDERVVFWKTTYSRVTNLEIMPEYLLVQLRTTRTSGPKFALLFYRRSDLSLAAIAYLNDLMVGVHNDKIYTFKGGNPGIDDDAGDAIVHIYRTGL